MRLIPNTITVTEQFALRHRIQSAISTWAQAKFNPSNDPNWAMVHTESSLQQLEKECGISCFIVNNSGGWQGQILGGFRMTNEKKYMWFILGAK